MPHEDLSDGLRLDRAIDSITVGPRHRRDVGDLHTLRDSITRVGLLCPLTVTPDGQLLCGWRRLEAVRQLGWKTVPVFVRRASAGLRDVIAEHDENTIREPLPLQTAEELYREYKTIETEQAAQRQHATRFHSLERSNDGGMKDGGKDNSNGPAESAGPARSDDPVPVRHGDARAKAAQMVTGTKSYTRLEHTGRIKDTREDPDMPTHIRAMAEAAWQDITTKNASPEKQWTQIRAAIAEHDASSANPPADGDRSDHVELASTAQAALTRPRPPRAKTRGTTTPSAARPLAEVVADLDEWINHVDVDALAARGNSTDLARLHRTTERLDHLCTGVHAAQHKHHPALRRKKPAGTQSHTVTDEQPPLW
ncbi:hypothetical protein GCM10027063_14200 [Promicromonospora xylanilytica]